MTDTINYSIGCEARGVEEGHRTFLQDDGSLRVKSESTAGVSYTVRFWGYFPGLVHFTCDCPAGQHPRATVTCKHAALAGRRLEREGLAVWRDGSWWSKLPAPVADDDPFHGLCA